MTGPAPRTLHYKRSHFATQLPVDYLYTPTHAWLARQPDGAWRAGLTKFATRMLGDIVDWAIETPAGGAIQPGDVLGWVEGFKAVSDIFCVVRGELIGPNEALNEDPGSIGEDCYGTGWLYAARGEPDALCMDVEAYRALLDKTIDRILEKQQSDSTT
jgi:glycine cleavage system H protein